MFLVAALMAIMVTAEFLSKTLKFKEVALAWAHMTSAWPHSLDPDCTGDGSSKHCPLPLLSQGWQGLASCGLPPALPYVVDDDGRPCSSSV